jgi:hypothetical protein
MANPLFSETLVADNHSEPERIVASVREPWQTDQAVVKTSYVILYSAYASLQSSRSAPDSAYTLRLIILL